MPDRGVDSLGIDQDLEPLNERLRISKGHKFDRVFLRHDADLRRGNAAAATRESTVAGDQ